MSENTSHFINERPIGRARGTRDWLPADFARLASLERTLLDGFQQAGYVPMRTPILELTELHERKSGAGIISKLYELPGGASAGLCLRPELTASIVRAYAEAAESHPWRVCMSGPVFRYESDPSLSRLREFTQVGVELLGVRGVEADAEVIGLADRSLQHLNVTDATVRIGHVGLILEILRGSGLPPLATSALVEVLSEAAAEGHGLRTLETTLNRLSDWLRDGRDAEEIVPAVQHADDGGVDRLFRHLVPNVTGRRSGHEIIGRLRRKWDLGHTLQDVLDRLRDRLLRLAELRGPAGAVLDRLGREFGALAPDSIDWLKSLLERLAPLGIRRDRIELDLGFGRGIGFYTHMIFELSLPTPAGVVEVCGGGRYDGLARVLGSSRDDSGVGFAFGLERLLGALDARTEGTP